MIHKISPKYRLTPHIQYFTSPQMNNGVFFFERIKIYSKQAISLSKV